MKYYFVLQRRRIERKLIEFGLVPILGIALVVLSFVLFSIMLFSKTEYADWIMSLTGLYFVFNLGEFGRNEHLKSIFSTSNYHRIRILENTILTLPFALFLLVMKSYYLSLGLLLFAPLLARIRIKKTLSWSSPTPFKRFPFEFIVGFRRSYWVLILSYFLCFKSIDVGNFNLGIFALGLVFLISMSFYLKPEKEFFVWIYSCSVEVFLRKKIWTSIIGSSILSIPTLIMLFAFFPENALPLVGVQLLGYLFVISIILAKYSVYPNEMSLPQAILYGLSLWFPPMFLVVLPLFYKKSKAKLIHYLA